MKIIAVDDERLALEALVEAIKEAAPKAEVHDFRNVYDALDYVGKYYVDVAFLDINMREMSGIEAAKRLKAQLPELNIIFTTGYDEYMSEAFNLHASGYVTKPITADKVKKEIVDLRYPVNEKIEINPSKFLMKAVCFGNFDCFTLKGEPIHFERQKSKELFAYLVYRHGATCTIREVAAILFEDDFFDKKSQVYIQKIISSMIKSLKEAGLEEVVVKQYNALGINKELIDCDYYVALSKKDNTGYLGEFMAQYSWAEDANWYLSNL